LKPISKEQFDKIFPELEKIYNHSNKMYKLWEGTVGKSYLVENIYEKITQYWTQGKITP
jgi:hypothetical protein